MVNDIREGFIPALCLMPLVYKAFSIFITQFADLYPDYQISAFKQRVYEVTVWQQER